MQQPTIRSKAIAAAMTGSVAPHFAGPRAAADLPSRLGAAFAAARHALRAWCEWRRDPPLGAGPATPSDTAEIDVVSCVLAPFVTVPVRTSRKDE
jgi:hypothetical protein